MGTDRRVIVRVAGEADLRHAASIAEAIRREVETGAIGMALRTPELLEARMLGGDALIALSTSPAGELPEAGSGERGSGCGGERWVGFCYVVPWEGGRFVATSALIVEPSSRRLGIARRLKRAALRLALERYPAAIPFGLSTEPAVARINLELGFRVVPYTEITRDPAFWSGCESCPHHAILASTQRAFCRCTAFVLPADPR